MTMQMSPHELADQARAEVADLLDFQLSPLGLAAMDALQPQSGQTILDIGCGAGQTLLQLATRVGPSGRVVGVDIASRVLAVASERTAGLGQVEIMQADAAKLTLPDAMADGIYSRFGVMALKDDVATFVNFRRLTKHGGRLAFVCWRSLEENQLDLLPLRAAGLDLEVDMTPFKFESRDYVSNVLLSSGFTRIEIEAFDANVSSGNLDAMMVVLTKVGPLGKLLRERPALRPKVEPRVREALKSRTNDHGCSLKAATWIVTATA